MNIVMLIFIVKSLTRSSTLILALLILGLGSIPRAESQEMELTNQEFVGGLMFGILSSAETPFERVPMRDRLERELEYRLNKVDTESTAMDYLTKFTDHVLEDSRWLTQDALDRSLRNLVWYLNTLQSREAVFLLIHMEFGMRKLISDTVTALRTKYKPWNLPSDFQNRLFAMASLYEHIRDRRQDAEASLPMADLRGRGLKLAGEFCRMVLSKPSKINIGRKPAGS